MTVIFSTIFKDDDDVIIGKLFMQVRMPRAQTIITMDPRPIFYTRL